MKPHVSDYFSITAAHYHHGGDVAILHFQFIFNIILEKIESAYVEELNKAHAIILLKGHGKDKNVSSI